MRFEKHTFMVKDYGFVDFRATLTAQTDDEKEWLECFLAAGKVQCSVWPDSGSVSISAVVPAPALAKKEAT